MPSSLRHLAAWFAANADSMIALILAVVIGSLSVLSDALRSSVLEGTTLLVVALIATALLRDRARTEMQFQRLEQFMHVSSPQAGVPAVSDDENLESRFTDLAQRLEGTFAELEELEAAMQARAAMARRLAAEAEMNWMEAEASREMAQLRKEEAEAFDRLLHSKMDVVAEKVDQRGKRTQRRYMLYGVALGFFASIVLDAMRSLLI
ncbi:hypothetical protein [Nonomuraea roseola]|uniref:DUF106 domain-containing protein n=1 Tax=Nonomuraea roseola TaxID=46179 RepID=A0ABV5Q8M5_9ACTN